MATTISPFTRPLVTNGWQRLVFMYVGPGKRRQWAAQLGSAGRPVPRLVAGIAGFASVLLSLFVFYLAGRIATYGVFFTDGTGAWGGPTLIGAWIVHALIAAPMVAAAMCLLVPLTNLVIRGLR